MFKYFRFLSKNHNHAASCRLRARGVKILIILMLAFSLAGINSTSVLAAGTTYYVDNTNPACSDAATGPQGTIDVPFCTLARGALKAAVPGDVVRVIAGTYAETVYPNSGTIGSPITFQAEPGVTVTGDPDGFGSAFAVSLKSYVVIDGFNITQTKFKGIYVDGSNHITITNNHVSYAGINAGPDNHMQGIYLKTTTYSTVAGNTTDHNSCIGIRLINNSDYNTVSNNTSFANSSTIAYPIVVVSDAAGIELTGSSHNTVIHNIAYGNEDSGINIYKNTAGVPSSYNLVIGNLSYGNGDHGIDHNNSPYNTVVGNTIHGNGTVGINFEGEAESGSHHATVINNISVGNGITPPTGSFGGNLRVDSASVAGTVLDYDLFNLESAAVQIIWDNINYISLAAFHSAVPDQEIHGLEANPLFAAPVLSVLRTSIPYSGASTTGDYHLSVGSPAIDSANADAPSEPITDLEGNARLDDLATLNTGSGVRTYDDRGAYEFQSYSLTITSANGTVTKNPNKAAYVYGEIVELTATPAVGWSFANWSGDATGTANPVSVTMNGNKSVTANYTQNQYTLTVTSLNGTVTKNPDKATYTYGEVVQLTATPAIGWSFANWSGDATGTANPVSVTMNGNKSVTANYTQNQYTLTITSLNGTVTKNPDKATYTYGEVVQLTATPAIGWSFANWSGDATGTTNPVSVTINGNKSVTANYTQNQYTLTVISLNGTVTKNPDKATYTYGEVVQLTATPAIGWSFANWSGDATGTANPVSVTINGNKSVTANYTQNQYTLTITSLNGTVTKNPDKATYTYGEIVELTATPAVGWSFANWSGDATGTTNPVSVTMNDNKSVTANYTQNQYTLTIISLNGTVTKNPDKATYTYGEIVELTATPAVGWSFANWSGDATGTTNPVSVTMNDNKSVTANYTQNQYTLTIISLNGTVTKNPDKATYTYGEVVQLTATPAVGWSFANWSGDATGTTNPVSVTMNGNKSVTANYTQNQYTLTVISLNGTVTKNPDKATYTYGEVVQLTATPAIGWSFANWSGDATGTTNPVSVTINGNKSVTANYTQNEYTLTIIIVGNGVVTEVPQQATYHYGDVVNLTAVADAGWAFASWSGDLTGNSNPQSITINGNNVVTATFIDITLPIVVSINRVGATPTNEMSVDYTVTFSEPVTGVDADDFILTTTGVSGAAVSGFSGIDSIYTVTVNTGSGFGTIRLDLIDDDTIKDAGANPLGGIGAGSGDFISGEVYTIYKIFDMVLTPLADFNGDGKVDIAVFRPSDNTWYIKGQGTYVYGAAGDIPVPADYNGDGKDDIAVFRPSNSTWYIKGQGTYVYGANGDIPVVADYNGDGKADIAVFRPSNSTWYIKGQGTYVYGANGDIPVVADYNGDGKADIAVFRPSNSTWYIRGQGSYLYGAIGDIPVAADYNGDGKADIAVFRPSNSTWYIKGQGTYLYGADGDVPVIGDYNGDGKADIAVFRPSNSAWYIKGIGQSIYGTVGDTPV